MKITDPDHPPPVAVRGSIPYELERFYRLELLHALARYLVADRARGRRIWRNWNDPTHRAAKSPAFLATMRRVLAQLARG